MEEEFDDGSNVDSGFSDEETADSEVKTETDDADDQDQDEFDLDFESKRGDNQEYLGLPVDQQLAKWHSNQRPLEVDLVTELDGTNLFFINAESMIVDLIVTKQVAFEKDCQFLRLIFAIEQQLHAFKASDGIFRLVFFNGLKKLLTSGFGESVWAFRQAFLMHCRTMGIDYAVFPHWYSDEYKAHVVQWRPSFTMVAHHTVNIEDEDDDDEDDEEEDGEAKEDKQAKAAKNALLGHGFHSLMLSTLSMKQHVAILHGVQRRGNRMMVFALEPECYNVLVDRGVQGAIVPILSGKDDDEEEDEEEEEGDVVEEFSKFVKKADKKLKSDALLRSFLTVRFTKTTLEQCKGQNPATEQLMKLVVKALIIQEIMLQQIPLDKRATALFDADDWELWENITGALDRYFAQAAQDLSKMLEKEAPEEMRGSSASCLDTCDLFDGRLYRFIFNVVIKCGLESKGKIGEAFFGFPAWLKESIEFMWSEAGGGGKQGFFPINTTSLKDVPGIDPPELPEKEPKREPPVLKEFQNEYLETLWKDMKFKNIREVEADDEETCSELFEEPCNWTRGSYLDSLKEEETMEDSGAIKQFKLRREQKIKEGKKITAKDLEFEKQFMMKRRMLALRGLHLYAKSLTGSDKLHPAIIMKEDKDKDKEKEIEENGKPGAKKKEEKAPKLSAKHQELLEANKRKEEEKIKDADKEKTKQLEPKAEALAEVITMDKFETDWLDLVLGFGRITDSMVGFPAITSALKTKEAQMKLIMKVVKSCRTAFKKMAFDHQPENLQPQVRNLVRHFYCLLQEAFRLYGKELDGKSIKTFQEALISIGFPKGATYMFNKWKEFQVAAQKAAEEAAAPAEKEKGGKEKDAKGKKDDKKEKDKKDDKKKKEDKEDKKKKKDKKDDDEKGDKPEDPDDFKVSKQVDSLWAGVGSDELVFQFQFLGPYMTRTVGNEKDPKNRVMFKPDAWQRQLLDIVDDNRSALVSAPTASGKTFIGYYVMDKVLRMDNDSVAVYVAPSKALANQVSAEIYARFSSKTYPAHSKNELLGVFLREYNSAGGDMVQGKWKMCQVLVTIPHILEMLLLSAQNQDWVKRLKYVIFDEVHCIGEQEGGVQWEHSMQTIPCPFIALSATVADPKFFHNWLRKVNKTKSLSEVEFVCHSERWNDLYKYVFADGMLRPLHPFCSLVEQSIKLNGLAADLSLTPQEMVQLWLEVRKQISEDPAWERLAPAKYFADRVGFLTKKDARQYEQELKDTFLKILRNGKLSSEGFSAMSLNLQTAPSGVMATNSTAKALEFSPPPRDGAAEPGKDAGLTDFSEIKRSSSYLQGSNLVRICKALDERQYLPGIIFNFSRKEIDVMLRRMVKELKDRQYDKYYGDEDKTFKSKKIMERRQKEYNEKKSAYEQALKMQASKNQEGKAARKNADEGEGRQASSKEAVDVSQDLQMVEPKPPIDLADEIDMEFSFHSPKALGQWQEEIDDMIDQMKFKGAFKGTNSALLEGLRRGIGMHHEACKTNYRQAVEVLFRRGYLRVIFATKTLALGINMPCRATVFCGDSLELNGLMYRQMSGRAGRRGFDLMGQVVFWDMGFGKVRRLISSDLSKLTGEFVLSPTALLRVLMCWEQTCDMGLITEDKSLLRSKEDLSRTLAPMFSMPFFHAVGADLDLQVAYHTRFSVEFLMREGLIGSSGVTRNLANLVTHLFEAEPANFLFSRLLGSGLLHKYLNEEAKNMKKGERRTHLTVKLVEVLGWFFYRKRLPEGFPKMQGRKKHLPSEGCPYLAPLPPDMLKVVKDYNASVFELFQQLAWTAASVKKFDADDDFTLPFSRRAFDRTWDSRGEPLGEDADFAKKYIRQKLTYRARAPLAAITGSGDFFSSPYDLVSSLRTAVLLDLNSLPMLLPASGPAGEAGELEATNSWAVDFMIHGKIKYLWEDNGIDATKAYKIIQSIKDTVKMAVAVMKVYCPREDIVMKTMQSLAAEIEDRIGGEKGK
mmetsp:Transcript_92223/g.176876  ORF Transcript_92223/g.176876 Transcript_92223/m.176876 type:complete len:1979 (-) Transcript_92223:351-6287(-)